MSLLAELDREVWVPFARAYATLDAELFASILDADHVRVASNSATICDAAGYVAETEAGFARARTAGDSLSISFRFSERIASQGRASERGVYALVITQRAGSALTFHGRFHTIARRTSDGWRLLVDYDDGGADAADFAAQLENTRPDGLGRGDSAILPRCRMARSQAVERGWSRDVEPAVAFAHFREGREP